MLPGPYEKVPLTKEEQETLLEVYHVRRRILGVVYFFLLVTALFYAQKIDVYDRYTGKLSSRWEDTADGKFISRLGMKLLNFTFLGGAIAATGVFFWFKRVYPLKKDADSGVKEKVPFLITRKEYFPLTGQFYVALDDPDYLHHEIDEETYYNCVEGGYIYIYRAAKSKFVFEENGRFTIM